jgi:UDP-N-acetylglucosamine--N-acetylmuramyl-(pentapeptide) pyrophosphoryl-undecaprenol N-acetylglucosamine transferase
MKIVFTGGGTGGHFTPIIAIAEKTNEIIDQEKIVGAKLYYFSNEPYDKEALFAHGLIYEEVNAGKMRTYFSIQNFFDLFKVALGVIKAVFKLFSIFPDVVFSKGGYASFPTLFAAKLLGIPVVIHESDSSPGRVNKWAGRFAKRVAVSFKETFDYFPKEHIAWTGQPIRSEIEVPADKSKAMEYFKLESDVPVLLILGGSQGAQLVNNTIVDGLARLLENYQIIHQTGIKNLKEAQGRADVILGDNPHKSRYHPIAYLNTLALKNASGAADLIISRAGSSLFEIAAWGVPAILIPITKTNGDHQRKNAFAYARAGACSVIEESNMTPNILFSEIKRIMDNKDAYNKMVQNAKIFYKPHAAETIAREIVNLALTHEK